MNNPFNSNDKNKDNLPTQNNSQFGRLVSSDIKLTTDQVAILSNFVSSVKYGISTYIAPIKCKAESCIYYSKCPLARASLTLPIGKDCPVEGFFIEEKMASLTKDLDIKPEELGYTYDKLLINDLSYYELLDFRASAEMAEDPKIVKEEVTGVTADGEVVMTSTVNPIIIFKEKVSKAKMKILEELIATRKARAADTRANSRDKSSQTAELLRRAKEEREKHKDKKPINADFEIIKDQPFNV